MSHGAHPWLPERGRLWARRRPCRLLGCASSGEIVISVARAPNRGAATRARDNHSAGPGLDARAHMAAQRLARWITFAEIGKGKAMLGMHRGNG